MNSTQDLSTAIAVATSPPPDRDGLPRDSRGVDTECAVESSTADGVSFSWIEDPDVAALMLFGNTFQALDALVWVMRSVQNRVDRSRQGAPGSASPRAFGYSPNPNPRSHRCAAPSAPTSTEYSPICFVLAPYSMAQPRGSTRTAAFGSPPEYGTEGFDLVAIVDGTRCRSRATTC